MKKPRCMIFYYTMENPRQLIFEDFFDSYKKELQITFNSSITKEIFKSRLRAMCVSQFLGRYEFEMVIKSIDDVQRYQPFTTIENQKGQKSYLCTNVWNILDASFLTYIKDICDNRHMSVEEYTKIITDTGLKVDVYDQIRFRLDLWCDEMWEYFLGCAIEDCLDDCDDEDEYCLGDYDCDDNDDDNSETYIFDNYKIYKTSTNNEPLSYCLLKDNDFIGALNYYTETGFEFDFVVHLSSMQPKEMFSLLSWLKAWAELKQTEIKIKEHSIF